MKKKLLTNFARIPLDANSRLAGDGRSPAFHNASYGHAEYHPGVQRHKADRDVHHDMRTSGPNDVE